MARCSDSNVLAPTTLTLAIAVFACACGNDDGSAAGTTTAGETGVATGDTTGDATATASTSAGSTSQGESDGSGETTGQATGTDTSNAGPCDEAEEGEIVCQGDTALVCDGAGGHTSATNCFPQNCVPGVGCVACNEDDTRCVGDTVQICSAEGTWSDSHICDPIQGATCEDGACTGACAPELLGTSYIGCDYYPTVTGGLWETVPWNFNFGVIVANATGAMATLTVTHGGATLLTTPVGANTAAVLRLPWDHELVMSSIAETGPSRLVPEAAYRVRSDQPVSVYQYNPLEYTVPGSCGGQQCFSNTNDASVLLPTNTWGTDYMVVSRNHWVPVGAPTTHLPGFYAVVAGEDNTTVDVTPSATGGIVRAGGGIAADGTGTVLLNEGDVLEVFTAPGSGFPNSSDLTGTIIEADKNIQVFGGHKCTNVPHDIAACDRLEESMLPLTALADEYIVTAPQRSDGSLNPNIVRITATADDTDLTYEPVQVGAPATIASRGEWVELAETTESFLVTATESVIVSQYMRGQGAVGSPAGDPSMALTVPTAQYREEYLVHAPIDYLSNWVNITAPTDASITVDGVAIPALTAIGATGFGVARVELNSFVDGNHRMDGDQAFGVSVYGYGTFTSFWYPGGLDLEPLPQ